MSLVVMVLGILYTERIIPPMTNIPPRYDCILTDSLNKINAMMNMEGVKIVDTTADNPEPNLLNDSRNNRSAIRIPRTPLKAKVSRSLFVSSGIGIEKRIMVEKKPNTPMKFFIALISIAANFFEEISKSITAEDQQMAVIIA